MSHVRRWTRFMLALGCLGALLILASCGGGGGSTPPPPSSTWDAMSWDQGIWQ